MGKILDAVRPGVLFGEDLKLSGKLGGKASIAMIFKRGGMDWAAIVESAEGSWSMSN